MAASHPVTPDGRYFIVRGRLWRCTHPELSDAKQETLTRELMDARRAIGRHKRKGADVSEARAAVDRAKVALGERGPAWWLDGAPDYNRRMARNTPYADWYRIQHKAAAAPERSS